MSAPGNYLTRPAGEEKRVHKRRPVNKPGTVYYLRRGVRGYTSQPCKMFNMSESGWSRCRCQARWPIISIW
ncbi:MAG: hypothetical protein KUA43_16085 [Hoeflea sp.]|uniref:hypothetical protein n=1 Tax=Hoeflea sp. TaxID=1940281 RepID=UPI001D87F3AF|nr:hypothetical protein [Hoeflea sp.]MBU4531680.1 hypothetical protein [Alphaproteobacteria bacterium]MBV1724956.1 hypothetical protein [Hoeflea sp.]MBV1760976.1 hypothetical protein [Hoeflea sp.]